jgi:hypothetical protein
VDGGDPCAAVECVTRSPAGSPSRVAASGRLATDPVRLADAANPARRVAEALPTHGETAPPLHGSQGDSVAAGTLSAKTLQPLCGYADFRRRLKLAVAELEPGLSPLPANRWRVPELST